MSLEQQLLDAVLCGQLEVAAALAWALGDDSSAPPPLELRLGSPWKSPNAPRPVLRPADFRVHVLNHVREQAELVLAAAEQETAGGGASEAGSQPPTPSAQGLSGGAPLEAVRGAPVLRNGGGGCGGGGVQPFPRQPQLPAAQPQQQRQQEREALHSPLQQQQQQQQPGAVNDQNFPTLAAAAGSGGGRRRGGAGRTSPVKQTQQLRPQQGRDTKRRTIAPARVAQLDVDPAFLPAAQPPPVAPTQQAQQAQQQGTAAAATPQRAAGPAGGGASAAAALPMSPPPIAVRLPAPGAAAVAASLLQRNGGRGEGACGAPGSPGGEGGTPKRITPVRLAQPAEVQPDFLAAATSATSPRSARRDMLAAPEVQQARSRPGSRLGTPLAAAALAAPPGAFARKPAADAGSSGGSGSGGGDGCGSGGPGSSSRSPLLWPAEDLRVCQQLSFDVPSPAKPPSGLGAAAALGPTAAVAAAAAAAGDGGKGGDQAGNGAGVAAAAHAGPAPPLDELAGLSLGPGAASAAGGAAADRQQRLLAAAARRMGGSAAADGFDAPGSSTGALPLSATRPLLLGTREAAGRPLQTTQPDSCPRGGAVHGQEGGVAQQEQQAQQVQQAAEGPTEGPQLCQQGRRLAQLHAGLLRCSSAVSLAAELDLLLNLVAVPAAVRIDSALAPCTVLRCGGLAQRYACCVLQSAGALVRGLAPPLLRDLAALPLLRDTFPELHASLAAALAHATATQVHTEKAYRSVRTAGGFLSLHGLPALTSDGRRTRSQEEQRRISNRESCRDEWFGLMREAAAQTHSFAPRAAAGAGAGDLASDSGRSVTTAGAAGAAAAGDEAARLARMQAAAGELLRRLRPDNYGPFAELLAAAVLQAAATGEALLDEELSSLAVKNVPRFASLNRRLAAAPAAGPSRGCGSRSAAHPPATAAGFGGFARSGRGGGGGGRGSGGGAAAAGAEELVAESLRLVAEFPSPQRLHILFLEAADSHRLNAHLARCMTAKLRALAAEEHNGAGLSERVAAMNTLALFLSYLAFTRAGHSSACHAAPAGVEDGGDGGSSSDAPSQGGHPPLDVAAALTAAASAPEGARLACTLPWVLRYLWFLQYDGQAVRAPYFRRLLRRIAALHAAPQLQPASASFGPAAFCLRAVLDEFAERMGPELLGPSLGIDLNGGTDGGTACPALSSLATVDGLLDTRFLHLCCPVLEHGRQLLAGRSSSSAGVQHAQAAQRARRPKKIRPTAPRGTLHAAAAAASAAAPAGRDGERDLLRLQLQRAFLEQYSTDEHKFKLRDVVDYVADVLAHNAASSAAAARLAPAADAIAARLKEEAAALLADASNLRQGPGAAAGLPHQQAQQVQHQAPQQAQQARQQAQHAQQRQQLDPSHRLYLEALAEELLAEQTAAALQQAQAQAERDIRRRAAQAMAALLDPALGPAVAGTAAAIAAEVATAAAEQRLRSEVPSSLRRAATEQVQLVLAAAARGGGKWLQQAPPAAAAAGTGGEPGTSV